MATPLRLMSKHPATPAAPRHLGAVGRELFRKLQREYDIRDEGGLTILQSAAESADRVAAARAAIAKHGELLTDRYGQPKVNPACQLEKDARGQFLQALKMLNIDLEPAAPSPRGRR
jgi:P27 family predicted phage terminase small subunit